jgi:RNA polymerase sigma factor (sigma-70 family)
MSMGRAPELTGGPAGMADKALLSACRRGDDAAFAELAARHAPYMQQLAERLLAGDHHTAQDVVQECLVKLYAAARRDDRELRVRPWLSVVVRNACMDEHRRRLPQPVPDAPDSAVEDADPFGSDPYLDQAWEALPARFRTVLHHRELLGLSYDEIATAMGISRSAVQTLLFRARGALRREYQRAGGELLGCGAFGLALLSLADGEPVRHGHQLASHLATCGTCRSAVDRLSELSDLLRLGVRAMDAPLQPPLGGFFQRCWTTLTQFFNTHAPALADVAHTTVVAGAVPLSFVASLVVPSASVTAAAPAPPAGQQAASVRTTVPITTLPKQAIVRSSQQPVPLTPLASPTPTSQRGHWGPWPTPSPTPWSWPWDPEAQPGFGPSPGASWSASPHPHETDRWTGSWRPQASPSEQPTAAPFSSSTPIHPRSVR